MDKPKLLSPEWWQQKDVSHPWCDRFCREFFEQDPKLRDDPKTYESVGVIFANRRNGDIVPVGITAIEDGNFIFQYHSSYLANPKFKPISETLPKQKERFVGVGQMLPYVDNLPAEGWFGKAQSQALATDESSRPYNREDKHMDHEPLEERYHRFMMFGRDYPGAVWATYIHNDPEIATSHHQHMIEAALRSRSSIAGVQPKLLGVEDGNGDIRPASYWETSTHIVKLPPLESMPGLMEYEYMSMLATKALLPEDLTVDARLTDLHLPSGEKLNVLAIKRFDRTASENGKIHFEEINQLLGQQNADRYHGGYVDIANVIREKMGQKGVQQFYARLMTQFLLGNSDNHCKNFALFTGFEGGEWRMTPDYDLAPTVNYRKSELALYATPHRNVSGGHEEESKEKYGSLDAKTLVQMGEAFGLSIGEISSTIHTIIAHIPEAKSVVMNDPSPRLDRPASNSEEGAKYKIRPGQGHAQASSKTSARQDFCDRIDGRAHQLFGSLDKYISYRASKDKPAQGGGYGGRG